MIGNNIMIEQYTILKIINKFKSLDKPLFNEGDNNDTYRFAVWNLYNRICEAIKSFIVLYENNRFYDAYIIAGHALETSSLLCYITENKTYEDNFHNYKKYVASNAMNQIIENLYMSETVEKDLDWEIFVAFLKLFYPFGDTLLKDNKNYKEVIDSINSRLGNNKEKIKLFTKNFSPLRPSDYKKYLSKSMNNIDEGRFEQHYKEYCKLKHSNILGSFSFEGEFVEETKTIMLRLVLGLVTYLDKYFKKDCMYKDKND